MSGCLVVLRRDAPEHFLKMAGMVVGLFDALFKANRSLTTRIQPFLCELKQMHLKLVCRVSYGVHVEAKMGGPVRFYQDYLACRG